MEIGMILILIFAISTMIFLGLAFFLPEWVGISKSNPHQGPEGITGIDDRSSKSLKAGPHPQGTK